MIVRSSASNAVDLAVRCLCDDGVIVAPCDTIYGFLGRVPQTESKLKKIKGRGETNPFLVLVPTAEQVINLSETHIPELLRSTWPGPLTLIVDTAKGTVGYRVPEDDFLHKVLVRTGPLFSTSVNRSGNPELFKIKSIIEEFENLVSLIIDAGDFENRTASTILDISKRPYQLLRSGALVLPEEIIQECR